MPASGIRPLRPSFRARQSQEPESFQLSLPSPLALFTRSLIIFLAHQSALTDRRPKTQMRDLFDEVAGKSPLDPEEAVRRSTRAPRPRRFYAHAGLLQAPHCFPIILPHKPLSTPSTPP